MTFKSVVTTLVLILLVSISAQAQNVVVVPSPYQAQVNEGAVTYVSSATPGTATSVNISTTPTMIYGLTANAGINTAGVQVWVNFFNAASASVTPGTTAPIISEPIQAGGTSNGAVRAVIMPFGSPLGLPVVALSFNCTTLRSGSVGTQVPCAVNILTKK